MTENEAAFNDVISPDGRIHDEKRIQYLQAHIRKAHRAIQDGVPLKGYFVWSLLDDFEWTYGYTKQFGIVYVDYKTLRRTPKESAYWYAKVIENNGLE